MRQQLFYAVEDRVFVGVQCRGTTGMQEQNFFAAIKGSIPNQIQEASHGLTGIHSVHQDRFRTSQQLDSIYHDLGSERITGNNIVVKYHNLILGGLILTLEQLHGALRQAEDGIRLNLLLSVNANAGNGDIRIIAQNTGQQSGVCSGGARGANNVIKVYAHIKGLL